MGSEFIDLTGKRFGKWTVLHRLPNRKRALMWLCQCDCGNIVEVHGTSLKSGTSTQCLVCRDNHRTARKHGLCHHPLYEVWKRIKGCTSNPNHQDFKYYGARGIRVCDEWANSFESFYDWSMSNGYEKGLTIDRINVKGEYSPQNCRWITRPEQALNRTDNRLMTLNGVTHTISEWSDITGIKRSTLYARAMKNWSPEKTLSIKNYSRKGGELDIQDSRR